MVDVEGGHPSRLLPEDLRRTVAISIVVVTVLFAINQLDVVVRGDATALV
jgi:hypothetical protein